MGKTVCSDMAEESINWYIPFREQFGNTYKVYSKCSNHLAQFPLFLRLYPKAIIKKKKKPINVKRIQI